MNARLALLTAALASTPALATPFDTRTVTLDFDDFDPAPNVYVDAGDMRIINTEGVTVSGGLLLGTGAFGIADTFGTQPNIYATVQTNETLSRVITISIDGGADSVSGTLFNGASNGIRYDFTARDAQGDIIEQNRVFLVSMFNGGQTDFRLESENLNGIHSVEFRPVEGQYFNYAVDNLVVTSSLDIPAPGATGALGLAGLLAARRRRSSDR